MKPRTLDSLTPAQRAQIEPQLATLGTSPLQPAYKTMIEQPPIISRQSRRTMNATERAFERVLCDKYGRENVTFEGLSFLLKNGRRYKPDFVVRVNIAFYCFEVKGTYRLHSESRSRMAFLQAVIDWPEFVWKWYEKQKDGTFRERV